MNSAPAASAPIDSYRKAWSGRATWLVAYLAFAALVFIVQGPQPVLGPDHLSYLQLADEILAACKTGEYWRETSSIRFYGVVLAYLHGWTGSHVLSMKLVLLAFSVLFLLAAHLFFSLFTPVRWQAGLFAVLSGFAVSFGITSWGITDSTALLPRTIVAPIVMFCMWVWFRFDGRAFKYVALVILALASVMHLSTFYAIGVLALAEAWDLGVRRRLREPRLAGAFLASLLVAGTALVTLEYLGVASKSFSQYAPEALRGMGFDVKNIDAIEWGGLVTCQAPRPVSLEAQPSVKRLAIARLRTASVMAAAPPSSAPAASGPLTAGEAWAAELSMRPWRNMPMPLTNVANALSSSALILLLGLGGLVVAYVEGPTRHDRMMATIFVAIPVFALMPQTILWILRQFTSVFPATIEEVRAIGLLMIPSLYFVLRLFRRAIAAPERRVAKAYGLAIVVAVLALPLFMKNLPHFVREGLLSAMTSLGVVDAGNSASLANARAALGISPGASSLYYSTQGVRRWLRENTPPGSRILTDRDDLVMLHDRVILGPRQVAVNVYKGTAQDSALFLKTTQAMANRDLATLKALGVASGADVVVVNWEVPGSAYADSAFSVVEIRPGVAGKRP
jgi:hypothetical protein